MRLPSARTGMHSVQRQRRAAEDCLEAITQLPLERQGHSVALGKRNYLQTTFKYVHANADPEFIYSTSQPSNTTSIFGGGAAKPAFGTSNTAGPSIFGGNNTGNAFGTTNK